MRSALRALARALHTDRSLLGGAVPRKVPCEQRVLVGVLSLHARRNPAEETSAARERSARREIHATRLRFLHGDSHASHLREREVETNAAPARRRSRRSAEGL